MKIRFCEKCNRMILEGFEFCPYCGVSVKSQPVEESLPRNAGLSSENLVGRKEQAYPQVSGGECVANRVESQDRLVLLDRLIRDLEILDDEMASIEIHKH